MKIDLHMHTRGSDGFGSPEQIVKHAIDAGLDGIAITDHHKTYTAEGDKVAKCAREAGLVVIRGAEYSTDSGHMLVFLPADMGAEDLDVGFYPDAQMLIDEVVSLGGACIPTHPHKGYRHKWGDKVRTIHRIAAIETINGHCERDNPTQNAQAQTDAEASQRCGTGGSDAHRPSEIGVAFTQFDAEFSDQNGFLKAIKSGKFTANVNQKRLDALGPRWKYKAPRKVQSLSLFDRGYPDPMPTPELVMSEEAPFDSLEDFDSFLIRRKSRD